MSWSLAVWSGPGLRSWFESLSLPVRSTSEIVWAVSGAIFAAAFIVSLDSIVTQALIYRRRADPGRNWEAATAAVSGLLIGDSIASEKFSAMLRRPSSRQIAIDALTNEARSNPEVMKCLRGRAEDVDSISRWVSDALADKDPGRRAYACEVVAMVRMRAGRGSMLAATSDDDPTVRVAACRSLAVIDPDATIGVLLGLLDNEGPWAASLLGDVVQRLPQDAVQSLVRRAHEWGASPALVRLLANVPAGRANDVLLGTLDDEDPGVRARSAEAIDATSPQSRDALTALLTDPDEGTRLGAVRSLSRSADGSNLLALFAAMSDSSRVVRIAAAEGLSRMPEGVALLRRTCETSTDPLTVETAELALWRVDSARTASSPAGSTQTTAIRTGSAKRAASASRQLVSAALADADATVERDPSPLHRARRPKAEAGAATRWLLAEMQAAGGQVEATGIRAAARTAGISSSAVDRARREIADIRGVGARSVWTLREDLDSAPLSSGA